MPGNVKSFVVIAEKPPAVSAPGLGDYFCFAVTPESRLTAARRLTL
jgi:hypothetical protein